MWSFTIASNLHWIIPLAVVVISLNYLKELYVERRREARFKKREKLRLVEREKKGHRDLELLLSSISSSSYSQKRSIPVSQVYSSVSDGSYFLNQMIGSIVVERAEDFNCTAPLVTDEISSLDNELILMSDCDLEDEI